MQENRKRNNSISRIMLIVPMLDQGGLERVCALTAQLLKKEYEVHLVVFNTDGMIYDVSGVHLIDLHLGAAKGKVEKIRNVFKRVKRVKQLKKQYQIQLTYSFGPTANIVNVFSKINDITWIGIRGYGALSAQRRMKFTCKKADRVISCTKIMEQEINQLFQTNGSATLYNPCDIEEIQTLAGKEICELTESNTPERLVQIEEFIHRSGKIVVSTGREHDVKGFWHLIKSFYILKQQIPDAKLMIIGAGEYGEYKQLARDLGIEQDVLFTGVQKNPFALMKKSDVYALTSDSEGFPNALIEAMACGLPCVSVNCKTGPAEILQLDYESCVDQTRVYHCDYGVLTPIFCGEKNLFPNEFSKEEEIFAQELFRLLTQKEQYQHYQKSALQRAQDFNKATYLQAMKEILKEEEKGRDN